MSEFPTGKLHVSFSEVKTWKECPFRHKLTYIDKVADDDISPHLDYGTILHEYCENFLENREASIKGVSERIREIWSTRGFDTKEFIDEMTRRAESQDWKYKHNPVDEWVEWAENSIKAIPDFLDKEFPGWECVRAEEKLYRDLEGLDLKFKGFIDAVLKVPKKRGKGHLYWIIDWKTAGKDGWYYKKKRDFLTQAQIILYKSQWCKTHNIDPKDVRCGFVLLKRGAKPGKVIELLTVSSGPKTMSKAEKMLSSMIRTVRRGFFIKNRNSCRFCPYKDTPRCP